jgi:serine/threonine-protein kinase
MRLADRGASPGEICAAEPQRALRAEMASLVTMEQAADFSLVARNGMMLASSQGEAHCGLRLANEVLLKRLAPVFAGSTAFVPDRPLSWIVAPVRAGEGAVAALAIGRDAGQRFARLLEITGMESSREAFAFDTRGAMLSASRFQADSAVAGRPGMSRLVRTAVEGIRAGDPEALQGVLLEPYRNHRDVDVIGAWRWLPERDMAVAVEIGATECPLQCADRLGVLFDSARSRSAAGLSL